MSVICKDCDAKEEEEENTILSNSNNNQARPEEEEQKLMAIVRENNIAQPAVSNPIAPFNTEIKQQQ